MDKFKLGLIAAAALLSTNLAFATPSILSATPTPTNALSKLHPPTWVTIINASSDYIYVGVNGTNIHEFLRPGYNHHLYSYDVNNWSVPLILYDAHNYTFFSSAVCRLAIVTVYDDYPPKHRINIDSELCN